MYYTGPGYCKKTHLGETDRRWENTIGFKIVKVLGLKLIAEDL